LHAFFAFAAGHCVQLHRIRFRRHPASDQGHQRTPVAAPPDWQRCSSSSRRPADGPHLVAPVRADAKVEKGVLIERPDETQTKVGT
jgi:hypothetical protein